MSPKRKAPGAAEAESNVRLERLDCGGGSYCTPDERFLVRRIHRTEPSGRLVKTRQLEITDLTGEFTFDGPVRTLTDAEESIERALIGAGDES